MFIQRCHFDERGLASKDPILKKIWFDEFEKKEKLTTAGVFKLEFDIEFSMKSVEMKLKNNFWIKIRSVDYNKRQTFCKRVQEDCGRKAL